MRFLLTTLLLGSFLPSILGSTVRASSTERDNTSTNTNQGIDELESSLRRQLQNRPCNAEFSRVTKEEISGMLGLFLNGLVTPGSPSQAAVDAVLATIKYDVGAAKVCMSCADVTAEMLPAGALVNESPYGFPAYCSEESHGYTAQHSALLFVPIDPSTDAMFAGTLRGLLAGRGTEISINAGSSDFWPDSVTAILGTDQVPIQSKLLLFRNFLVSGLAAAGGAVSILPDYLGYGNTKDWDRSFLTKSLYMQSFGLSYMAAQKFVALESNGCSELDNVATVTGYSEGGYASTLGALAIQQNGVRILSHHPGGSPFDLDYQVGWTLNNIATLGSNLTVSNRLMIPFLGYSYSIERPFLANSGLNQTMLNPVWMDETNSDMDVISWFVAESALGPFAIVPMTPPILSDMANPAIVNLYAAARDVDGTLRACEAGATDPTSDADQICQTFLDNTILDAIQNDIDFPTWLCHSEQDALVGYGNLPSNITNDMVTQYDNALFPISGDHTTAQILCALDPVSKIALAQGDDTPTMIKPLENPPAQCVAGTLPPTPTAAPVGPGETSEPASAPAMSSGNTMVAIPAAMVTMIVSVLGMIVA